MSNIGPDRKSITVFYKGPDRDLDNLIEEALASKGFERWASGSGMGERDLCFFVPKENKMNPSEVLEVLVEIAELLEEGEVKDLVTALATEIAEQE